MLLFNIIPALLTSSDYQSKKKNGLEKSEHSSRHHKSPKSNPVVSESTTYKKQSKYNRSPEEPYAHLNCVSMDHGNKHVADVVVDGPSKPVKAFLMENRDVNDNNGWKVVCPYNVDRPEGSSKLELALPQNVDQNKHYCFRIRNEDGSDVYTNPYYLGEQCKWQPSRSVVEEMKHREENGEPTKYTTEEIKNEKKGKKTTDKKTKNVKKNTTNSAGSLFCTLFAGVAIIASIMM